MIKIDEVLEIYGLLINKFGGYNSIRDLNALESALARPFQTFDGKELYSTPVLKAAALLESILINHPFIDGNKRIGYTLLRLYLLNNQLDLIASEDEKYNFIISVASEQLLFEQITEWLSSHIYKTIES